MSKARLAVVEAEDDLSILQQEMKGLANQIDAQHREDDTRRERSLGGNDGMVFFFVEEADSGEEVGVQGEGGQKRKVCKGRFGELHMVCRRRTRTFKRNMGPHGGDDVSSVEGDNPPVGVRVEDSAETL